MTNDIAALAADVQMKSSYLFYAGGSDLIHSNPSREREYVRTSGREVHFNSIPTVPDSGLTPLLAAHHLLLIADVVNDGLRPDSVPCHSQGLA